MTTEQLTALARAYAVKQAQSGAEYLSAGQGFQDGYKAGVEEMRAENEKLKQALESERTTNARLRRIIQRIERNAKAATQSFAAVGDWCKEASEL